MADMEPIERTILIQASSQSVWKALTEPALMKQWMGDPEMQIDIQTDWKMGSPVRITGIHHGRFVNTGTVLENKLHQKLVYTHRSSVSRLPDVPDSYTVYDFTLEAKGERTLLAICVSNFPTESIYKHMLFYWGTTLNIIKQQVEKPA